jgi:hypothetical protein
MSTITNQLSTSSNRTDQTKTEALPIISEMTIKDEINLITEMITTGEITNRHLIKETETLTAVRS